jgi:hypothetical protein
VNPAFVPIVFATKFLLWNCLSARKNSFDVFVSDRRLANWIIGADPSRREGPDRWRTMSIQHAQGVSGTNDNWLARSSASPLQMLVRCGRTLRLRRGRDFPGCRVEDERNHGGEFFKGGPLLFEVFIPVISFSNTTDNVPHATLGVIALDLCAAH